MSPKSKVQSPKSGPPSKWMAVAIGFALAIICIGATVPIYQGLLQSDLNGGGNCITNLSCLGVGSETVSNLTATNITVQQINVSNITVQNVITTNQTCIDCSYVPQPVVQAVNSNSYALDFGQTNAIGARILFAVMTPTNDVYFPYITNCTLERSLSLGLYAVAARKVYFPTNMFLATNGGFLLFTNDGVNLSNTLWELSVPAGSFLRFDMRSNLNGFEPQFQIKP